MCPMHGRCAQRIFGLHVCVAGRDWREFRLWASIILRCADAAVSVHIRHDLNLRAGPSAGKRSIQLLNRMGSVRSSSSDWSRRTGRTRFHPFWFYNAIHAGNVLRRAKAMKLLAVPLATTATRPARRLESVSKSTSAGPRPWAVSARPCTEGCAESINTSSSR